MDGPFILFNGDYFLLHEHFYQFFYIQWISFRGIHNECTQSIRKIFDTLEDFINQSQTINLLKQIEIQANKR